MACYKQETTSAFSPGQIQLSFSIWSTLLQQLYSPNPITTSKMLSQSLLIALAATAATAHYHGAIHPGALAAKRDLHIAARQTQTDDGSGVATACLDGLMSIYSSLPTPPPQLVDWEETASITDPCSITIPASVSAAFSSYESEALSWYTQHSSEIFSALSQCPQYSSVAAGGGGAPAVCTGHAGGAGVGGGSATTTGGGDDTTTSTDAAGKASTTTTPKTTGTASPTGSKSSGSGSSATSAGAASTKSTNAGPRETGFVAGAVAVAGFLGVVAAL